MFNTKKTIHTKYVATNDDDDELKVALGRRLELELNTELES